MQIFGFNLVKIAFSIDKVYRLDSKTFISQSNLHSIITYLAYLTASTKCLEVMREDLYDFFCSFL